jgi:hypothetical protein
MFLQKSQRSRLSRTLGHTSYSRLDAGRDLARILASSGQGIMRIV